MKLPPALHRVPRPESGLLARTNVSVDHIQAQGCNALEWIGCAAAVAGCGALTGPALVACLAGVAPGCIRCVT
jgi:hypothetical protein